MGLQGTPTEDGTGLRDDLTKDIQEKKGLRLLAPYRLLPIEGRTMAHTRRKNYTPQKTS